MPLSRRQFIQALLATSALPGLAQTRPDLTRTMGNTLADRDSSLYRFEDFRLDSADGERHYRIWLGIPRSPAPAGGYPSLTLLDGNAALHHLREDWLSALPAEHRPVLVMVGYDTDLLFDVVARQRDYTPAGPGEGLIADPLRPDRLGGGAEAFLRLLEQRIKPEVARRVSLDSRQQSLWGHSFGGLFALYAMTQPSSSFTRYIPVSPAVYWHDGVLQQYLTNSNAEADIWLARGSNEVRITEQMDAAEVTRLTQRGSHAFMATVKSLADQPGLSVHWKQFPELGHGPMLPTSLPEALAIASGQTPAGWHPQTDAHNDWRKSWRAMMI
ncbi:alpha/beta hydrolase [Pseudomonas sp.]|uniref:alpha/beta hydrolase n=1 Tax=Pseudomonas sp. TaxID=306 RepID=UPI003CC62CD6|tara:strand:+ start:228 stop:1211 length:984 start_codon:yes stop_codon:yes gene_type:complete